MLHLNQGSEHRMDVELTRRGLILPSLAFLGAYTLLGESTAVAGASKSVTVWLTQQDELARGLAAGTIPQAEWARAVGQLASEVDLVQLRAEIRGGEFTAMPATGPQRDGPDQPFRRQVRFRAADGSPMTQPYSVMILNFRSGDLIPPHMHRNSAALHLMLEGTMRVRAYNRIGDEDGAAVIVPSREHVLKTGAGQTMTTEVDNVHWFVATSRTATALNLSFDELGPAGAKAIQQPIDLKAAQRRADGSMRAPFISWDEGVTRYAGA